MGLRGSYEARIDDKGRLKIPSQFRDLIERSFGTVFYITSLDGETARVYPLPEWEAIESRVAAMRRLGVPYGDEVRRELSPELGFSRADRDRLAVDGQRLVHPPGQATRAALVTVVAAGEHRHTRVGAA